MENSQTFSEVVKAMRESADSLSISAPAISSALRIYADEAEVAHRREIESVVSGNRERAGCSGCGDDAMSMLAGRLKDKIEHHGYAIEAHRQDDIKAQMIIEELSKEWSPIDRGTVSPSADGMVHFADMLKAADERRINLLLKCLDIAEGKCDTSN